MFSRESGPAGHCTPAQDVVPSDVYKTKNGGGTAPYRHTGSKTVMRCFRPQYLTFPAKYLYASTGRYFRKAVEPCIKRGTDVFHVHYAYPGGCVIPGIKKDHPKAKVFLSVHGNDWYLNKKDPRIRKMIYRNMQFADRIFTVGRELEKDISRTFPEIASRIRVLFNGVHENIIHTEPLQSTFSGTGRTKVLTVGAFAEGKGIHILLKALGLIGAKEFEVVVIGSVTDPEYFQYVKELRHALNLDGNVKFLTDRSRKEVYQHMRECDFFILPSLKEGFGIALVEALMFNKPVISTLSGGPADIVNDRNGLLVEPGDPEKLAGAIAIMNRNYHQYPEHVLSEEIRERFGMKKVMKTLLHYYTGDDHEH
ncbi:MAG: glycosyltransferase [Candidatus Marinimicrobia bacterium]|nr:glycosyltransferase [Candidatus Neomarinimicrobiota bacterium]